MAICKVCGSPVRRGLVVRTAPLPDGFTAAVLLGAEGDADAVCGAFCAMRALGGALDGMLGVKPEIADIEDRLPVGVALAENGQARLDALYRRRQAVEERVECPKCGALMPPAEGEVCLDCQAVAA